MNELELPTLAQITDWDVEHLVDAAAQWNRTADLWEDSFHDVWQGTLRPGGTTWEGSAAENAQDIAWRDLVKVRGSADSLRTAANIAHTGAASLHDVKRLALNAIDEAHTNEFTVADDLSVTEVRYRFVARERESREAMADDHSADIRHLAANLVALDRDIAHRLRAAMAGIDAPIYSV
ncbi:hypothetical protein BOO86_03700 [Mycobacterium sp. CBMA 234]|uniref:hypothetical protein n=1 Tax=Mycolicibacterium sp. CBMA 234 TaxID=1918495 RepID=UPI0012DF421D|nr:hypothetical protein [Mycolicibacterium sp. CBMA 234]MUL63555.1 hypothetical protein [Mycolicibacterium sp. CBMA 234]